MPTRDGNEVLTCDRCALAKDDAKPRIVVKGESEFARTLCDACAENVAGTYTVKAATGRRKAEAQQDGPSAPVATESTAERRVAGEEAQKRS